MRLLTPRVSITMPVPMRIAATTSILTFGFPLSERSQKLRMNTATARMSTMTNTSRQPTRVASVPPIRNALTPAKARAEPSDPMAVAC